MQTSIPCVMMRGGTSRGPYFKASDLPIDTGTRDKVLLAALGSPDAQQIDGIGGGTSLTSKVAIVSPSDHPEADVDFLFAQVSVEDAIVDTSPTCGNILTGVGPFAIESGFVQPQDGETLVRIHSVNTTSLVDAIVQTPNGQVEYEGTTAIDGVPGTAAPVILNFKDIVGSKTGALLPTGNVKDTVEGTEVSCVDCAVPMVIMAATSLGKTGYESKEELDQDQALLDRLESVRLAAARLMGMGDARGKVVPKVGLLTTPSEGDNITSRYFVPSNCHAAHAVTGAICVAVTTALKGSVADGLAIYDDELPKHCVIDHPSGNIKVTLDLNHDGKQLRVNSAGVVRTARKLYAGEVYVPASVWKR